MIYIYIYIYKVSFSPGTPQKPFGAETGKKAQIVLRGYVLNTEDVAGEWRLGDVRCGFFRV